MSVLTAPYRREDFLAALLKALKELQAKGPVVVCGGICLNVQDILDAQWKGPCRRELTEVFQQMGLHPTYPVPHPEMGNEDAYESVYNIWAGEYGDARRALLDQLIEHFSHDQT